jgi:hypothetical protein
VAARLAADDEPHAVPDHDPNELTQTVKPGDINETERQQTQQDNSDPARSAGSPTASGANVKLPDGRPDKLGCRQNHRPSRPSTTTIQPGRPDSQRWTRFKMRARPLHRGLSFIAFTLL